MWSLHASSQLLYSSCLAVRYDDHITDVNKGHFAARVWIESDEIEAALNIHTCGVEKALGAPLMWERFSRTMN